MPTISTTNHYVKYYHNYSTYVINSESNKNGSAIFLFDIYLDNNYNISVNVSIKYTYYETAIIWRVKIDQFFSTVHSMLDFARVKVVYLSEIRLSISK